MEAQSSPDGKAILVHGKVIKIAQLRDEYYVSVSDPTAFLSEVRAQAPGADIFTFVQEIDDPAPKYPYHQEWDHMAVLPLTTYEHWFNKQITFKPRNKIRKAMKSGVEIREVAFDDEFIRGIMGVYNETPVRQGKKNRHYNKEFDVIKREHSTFLDRSEFIGAYFGGDMIGFVKVTHCNGYSIIMNILSKIAFREKAPSNLLINKTVEVCCRRKSKYLNYGIWGRRGLNDFKVASAFEDRAIPRYFVPLTTLGRMAIRTGAHRPLIERVPEKFLIVAADIRTKWYERKYPMPAGPANSSGPEKEKNQPPVKA